MQVQGAASGLGPASAVLVLGGGGGLGVGGRGRGAGQLRPRGQRQHISPPAHAELGAISSIIHVCMFPVHFTAHNVWTVDITLSLQVKLYDVYTLHIANIDTVFCMAARTRHGQWWWCYKC